MEIFLSPEDHRDWIFEHLAKEPSGGYFAEFPPAYSLRRYSLPPRNQGDRGTCAAFTGAEIKEILDNKRKGKSESDGDSLSPEFIYRHRDNKHSSGMYGRNVFRILQKIGTVPESHYPYKTHSEEDDNIPAELYKLAARYRITSYARVETVDGVKKALLEVGPCYLLLPLYSTRPEFWRRQGNERGAAHSVAVIGYDEGGFTIKNSWGSNWNGDGCIHFPFSDWSLRLECWVCGDEGNNLAMGVSNSPRDVGNTHVISCKDKAEDKVKKHRDRAKRKKHECITM